MQGRRRRWALLSAAAAVVAVVILAAPPVPAPAVVGRGSSTTFAPARTAVYGTVTNITYNASTDGWPLSYGEILPSNYNASLSYPLLVYLHGKGQSSSWFQGGSNNGLTGYQTAGGITGITLRGIVSNASANGFILMAPSPRSEDGFYLNSPCGGPQAQDTLDAIAHEQSVRHIGKVYLLGFSMGSLGAVSLAGHHPGMFAGIAVSGVITDAFEEDAYRITGNTGLLGLTCNVAPSPTNASAAAFYLYNSVMRFVPTNFSGLRMWVSAGGLDISAVNNASRWPYEQVNNTFLNSTCLVVSALGEPTNCTRPFSMLHAVLPSSYPYRFVYEPLGTHLLSQFDPHDLMIYLLGKETGGCFDSSFPPSTFRACT